MGRIALVVIVLLLLFGAKTIASYAIEIAWWKELGQFRTWMSMVYYGLAPVLLATLVAFAVLWMTHARALKFARTSLRDHRIYAWLSGLVLLLISYLIAASAIDTWTVVRYTGSRNLRRRLLPGMTPSSASLSRFTCSICRFMGCCAATCWPW